MRTHHNQWAQEVCCITISKTSWSLAHDVPIRHAEGSAPTSIPSAFPALCLCTQAQVSFMEAEACLAAIKKLHLIPVPPMLPTDGQPELEDGVRLPSSTDEQLQALVTQVRAPILCNVRQNWTSSKLLHADCASSCPGNSTKAGVMLLVTNPKTC